MEYFILDMIHELLGSGRASELHALSSYQPIPAALYPFQWVAIHLNKPSYPIQSMKISPNSLPIKAHYNPIHIKWRPFAGIYYFNNLQLRGKCSFAWEVCPCNSGFTCSCSPIDYSELPIPARLSAASRSQNPKA